MITGGHADLLNGNQGQEREGGDDKNADGGTTSSHMWAQLGRDWRRIDADGFYMKRATLDSGWNSQQGKARQGKDIVSLA